MQWIAHQSEWSKERIGRHMMHLRIFYEALREPGLLKLPAEMIATIFKHMKKSDFIIWILKIVKNRPPQRHIHYISQAVEIWCGADDDTAGPQNPPKTFQ